MAGMLWSSGPFTTTANLAGTTLNYGGNVGPLLTGPVTLANTADFPASGYLMTTTGEVIAYNSDGVGANQLNFVTRGALDTPAQIIVDGTNIGEAYHSRQINTGSAGQMVYTIGGDEDSLLVDRWYEDAAQTFFMKGYGETATRALTSYNVELRTSPCFGNYYRAILGNIGGATTQWLYFSVGISDSSLAVDTLSVEFPIVKNMNTLLTRAAIVASYAEGEYENAGMTDKKELLSNTQASARSCTASFSDPAVVATKYVLMVQTSNDSGAWPHAARAAIKLDVFDSDVVFAAEPGEADLRVGVITRIDATDADVTWLVSHRTGGAAGVTGDVFLNYHPTPVHFEQDGSGGVYGAISSAQSVGIAAINTDAPLASPDTETTPSLGDIVVELGHVATTFSVNLNMSYHSSETWNGIG